MLRPDGVPGLICPPAAPLRGATDVSRVLAPRTAFATNCVLLVSVLALCAALASMRLRNPLRSPSSMESKRLLIPDIVLGRYLSLALVTLFCEGTKSVVFPWYCRGTRRPIHPAPLSSSSCWSQIPLLSGSACSGWYSSLPPRGLPRGRDEMQPSACSDPSAEMHCIRQLELDFTSRTCVAMVPILLGHGMSGFADLRRRSRLGMVAPIPCPR